MAQQTAEKDMKVPQTPDNTPEDPRDSPGEHLPEESAALADPLHVLVETTEVCFGSQLLGS